MLKGAYTLLALVYGPYMLLVNVCLDCQEVLQEVSFRLITVKLLSKNNFFLCTSMRAAGDVAGI